MIVVLLVCLARYARNALKNMNAISLQYRQVNVKDKVDLFLLMTVEDLFQIDNLILDACD